MKKTVLPYNVEDLPKEDVVSLLKRVAAERDDVISQLESQKPKKQKITHLSPAPTDGSSHMNYVSPSLPAAAPVASFNVEATKKRIFKNATARIKKTVHTDRNKPYTEVLECVPSDTAIMSLMDGIEPKSDRAHMKKWMLNEQQIMDWLMIHDAPLIHPVTNKINTICLFGEKPNIYAYAKIESLEVKWERKSGSLTLKFRTLVAGTGRPPHFCPVR